MRRLVRWFLNGLCLLSLLACLGTALLWWRATRTDGAWVEVAALHTHAEVSATPWWLAFSVTERWPGGAGVWAGEGDGRGSSSWVRECGPNIDDFWEPPRETHRRDFAGVVLWSGWVRAYSGPDGTPLYLREWRAEFSSPTPGRRWSEPLPRREAFAIPYWATLTFFALPPLLWLAPRSRRLFVRRRRRRLGLCLRCGYDLTSNTSGTCSECGEPVQAEGRV